MAITLNQPALTLTYIVFSWFTTLFSLGLAVVLFRNFLKKKTTGTLILFVSYLFAAISAIIGAFVYTFEIIPTINIKVSQLFQTTATVLPLITLLLIYIFTCRHILQDNEVSKSIHLIATSLIIGFIATVYVLGVFNIIPQINDQAWYYLDDTQITSDLTNFSIRILSVLIIFPQVYYNARIFIRAFVLSRRTDKLVRKRGLLMIGWGLVIYLIAGMIIGFEFQANNSTVIMILWMIRKLLFITSYVFLYLGWVMPDWFRRRMRSKTWFEMRYKEVSKFVSK